MKQIISFLEAAKLARKQVHRNLTVFPLLAPNEIEPDYLILDQALNRNLVRITELDNGASVPELKLKNLGKKKVLIIEGEELIGAKQNRIVNSSFLIVGKTEVIIPVSCVEQGRWNYKSESFKSGKRMAHPSLRREYQQDVSYSIRQGEGYRSNQDRIWNNIAEKSVRMNVDAPTGAMADVFDSYEDEVSGFLDKFHLIEWQVGAVFAINGQILGLEGFGCHDTFKRFFDKLVKSYALDALDNLKRQQDGSVPPEKVRRFIKSTTKSKGEGHPSIGLGTNITFESRAVSGIGLVEEDHVLHLSAFKKEKRSNFPGVGFQRYSHRRTRRIY
jgi:hypothetical protein